VIERLTGLGVETIVLKGLPLIDQLYPDPAQRVLYDFDLLAREPEQARRGLEALRADGYTPVPTKNGAAVTKHLPSVWKLNGFVRRSDLFDPALPRPVELHVTLWDAHWRGLDVLQPTDLWVHSRRANVDSTPVRILSPEHTLMHLCVHLSTHLIEREARLGQALDVGRLLVHPNFRPDWERLLAAAAAANVSRLVYLALSLANSLAGAPLPPSNVMDRLRQNTPPRLAAWAERAAAADLLAMDYRRPDLHQAYALTFAAARTRREQARVLRFALLPSRSSLEQEYAARGPWVYVRHIGGRGRVYLLALAHRRAHSP
jgi:hypothetical protein